MEPFLGQISMMGFSFAPKDWAPCHGQLLPISQYSALFSLLGTRFGGNGINNFGLPNLQGRFPVGRGSGTDEFDYSVGDEYGSDEVTLSIEQMPAHTHSMKAAAGGTSSPSPQNMLPADVSGGVKAYAPAPGATAAMSPSAILQSGQSLPFNILPPYLCLNFVISINGMFPSRP